MISNYKNVVTKLILSFVCTVAFSSKLNSQTTLTANDVSFNEYSGKITAYNANYTNIIIPDTFNVNGKKVAVNSIGDRAFYKKSLVSVILPESVTSIGKLAFYDNSLTNLTISDNVTSIGEWAFADNELTSLALGNGIKSISEYAFYYNSLTNVELPNIISIGCAAFSMNSLKAVIIPNSVKKIDREAFSNNDLSSVILPDSLKIIGYAAFTDNEITSINGKYSKGLIYARNSDGTEDRTRINSYGGTSLIIDFIPDGVTSIDSMAFSFCYIDELLLPNTVKTINYKAFQYNSLSTLVLPNSIQFIGEAAFNKNSIEEINGMPSNGIIYKKNSDRSTDYSTIVSFAGYQSIIDFIPSHVKNIGKYAFEFCRIREIKIPNSVETIGERAFYYSGADTVIVGTSVAYIGAEAFARNDISSIILPSPVIKEGYQFKFWTNSLNGSNMLEIRELDDACEAHFNFIGFIAEGKVNIESKSGLTLDLSGDIEGTREVDTSGFFNFALNAGRTVTLTPVKKGYTFTPQSIDITNIQENIDSLNFIAEINTYTVTFVDYDGTQLKQQTVTHGSPAEAPTDPFRDGYNFTGWDKPFAKVTSDLIVTANYSLPNAVIGGKNDLDYKFYPNPVKDKLTIEIPASSNISAVEICNILGESIHMEEAISGSRIEIDLYNLPCEILLLKITGKNGYVNIEKIIKQ